LQQRSRILRRCRYGLVTVKIVWILLNVKNYKFQPEFMEIKRKYEEACSKLKFEAGEAEALLTERERLYAEYIHESSIKYDPMQVRSQFKKSTSSSVPGIFGKFLK
jgi:predicted nuclease with TOPRIM domain